MKRTATHRSDFQQAWLPPETTAFAASYVATACGIAAVAFTVDHSEFTRTVFFLLTAGYVASFSAQMEHVRWGRALRAIATMIGLGGIPLLSFFVSPSSIFPVEALTQEDLRTAVLLAWLAVIFSYLIGSYVLNRWIPLSFPIVPTLSMFALIATMNPNMNIVAAFMVFVCASIFLVSYENTIRRSPPELWTPAKLKSVSYQHFVLAGGFFLPVVAVAGLLAVLIQWISPPALAYNAYRFRNAMVENLFSNSFAGFYDSFDLRGGSILQSHAPRMVVYSREGFNWRGRAYNRYDGSGWQQRGLRDRSPQSRMQSPDSLPLPDQVPPHHDRIDAKFECYTLMPRILYSPGLPMQVVNISNPNIRVRVDLAYSLLTSSPIPSRARYLISAAVPRVEQDIDALRQAEGSYPDDFRGQSYLQLPSEDYRLGNLAVKIVTGQRLTRPYEKAEALVDFLHKQCKYSLTAPHVPPLQDAAEFFVFDSRQGACDMFATALALMCRAVDLPARVVTGYAQGTVERDRSTADRKAFVVTDSDAHAWVEIYVNSEWEWIPLDPSAGTEQVGDSWLQKLVQQYRWSPLIVRARRSAFPVAMTAILLWCALQLIRQPRAPQKSEHRWGRRLTGPRGEVCKLYVQMCRHLRKHGWARDPSSTASEFLERIRGADERMDSEERDLIQRITERFATACYSERPVPESEVAAVKRELKELRHATRRTRRKKLMSDH